MKINYFLENIACILFTIGISIYVIIAFLLLLMEVGLLIYPYWFKLAILGSAIGSGIFIMLAVSLLTCAYKD